MSEGTAIIIGASSGIGAALARQLAQRGWRLILTARRMDLLESLARDCGNGAVARAMNVATSDVATAHLDALFAEFGAIDLVVISAGTGHLNRDLQWARDRYTLDVNVIGFAALAQAAMRNFLAQERGHLVGITSVGALRGRGEAAAYAASKAFQSVYLDSLRDRARQSGLPIFVTEAQPGFVDTAMMKTDQPLPWLVKRLLVASPEKAAAQILRAIERRAKHAYVTRRYGLIAFVLRRLPRPG